MLAVTRRYLFSLPALLFISGLLSALAQAPFYFIPLMAVPYILWLKTLLPQGQSKRRVFGLSFLVGFGIHLGGLFWIGNAMLVANSPYLWAYPFATAGLPILFGLYYGFAGLVFRRFNWRCSPDVLASWLGFAAIIGVMEYIRSFLFTGYPWNLPSYIWMATPVAQSLAYIGPYALTTLTIALLTLPILLYRRDTGWQRPVIQWPLSMEYKAVAITLALFVLMGVVGILRLENKTALVPDVSVLVVQPNIAQGEKWNSDLYEQHFAKLVRLSKSHTKPNDDITTLIVWPETALSTRMLETDETVKMFQGMIASHGARTHLFSGILRREDNKDGTRSYFNSLMAWGAESLSPVAVYDKSHLVPFGEYMPFEKQLNLAPIVGFSGFKAGGGVTTQSVPHAPPFSPLICYEVVFPHAVADSKNRPTWLLNVTNDGWYGNSPGPYQHWDIVRARAIEEGLPAVRSANTGLSGVIDAYGRPLFKTQLGQTVAQTLPLPAAIPATPYSQHGELFFKAIIALIFGMALIRCIKSTS